MSRYEEAICRSLPSMPEKDGLPSSRMARVVPIQTRGLMEPLERVVVIFDYQAGWYRVMINIASLQISCRDVFLFP